MINLLTTREAAVSRDFLVDIPIVDWLNLTSSNTIQVKGNVILAKYFVYIEVYDFAISEDEEIQVSSAEVKQKTTIGLQVRFVDAETGEIITGSGLGEAITVKKASLLDGVDEVKFNQSRG